MFLLRRFITSVKTSPCFTSGCVRYHSAKASSSLRNSGLLTPPVSPAFIEYSMSETPVRSCVVKSVARRTSTLSSKYFTNWSFNSLRGTKATIASDATITPHSSARRRVTTKSATLVMNRLSSATALGLTRSGMTASSAGRKNTVNTSATSTPIAVMLPRSRNGGASLKFMLRNPTAVVTEVNTTACMFTRNASSIASYCRLPSWRMRWRMCASMWAQSTTTTMRMMMGAEPEAGESLLPSQPAMPIATNMEHARMMTVTTVTLHKHNNNHNTTTKNTNNTKNNNTKTRTKTTKKTKNNNTTPETWMSSAGFAASILAANARAASATSRFS